MSDVFDPDTTPAPTQDYSPMPEAAVTEDKRPVYDGENADNLRAAAAEVTDARQRAEAEPIDRGYRYDGGTGKPVEPEYTLDARRAADDLERVRAAEVANQQPPTADTAAAIDAFRNQLSADPQATAQSDQTQQPQAAQQQQQQPQPQSEPAPDGIDPEIAEALSRPKVRAALEETVAQVEQHRAAYAQAARQAAQVSAAAVLANYPELTNLTAEQFPLALQVIAKENPAKAAAIEAQLNRVQALYNQSQQAQQQAQNIQAARFQEFARTEDARFEKAIADEPIETRRAVLENGKRILSDYYGIDAKALAQAVEGNPALRAAGTQALIYDAIKGRIAEESIASKVARPVPPVQRPGVAGNHARDSDVEAAMKTFQADPSPKTASRLLIARRAAANR